MNVVFNEQHFGENGLLVNQYPEQIEPVFVQALLMEQWNGENGLLTEQFAIPIPVNPQPVKSKFILHLVSPGSIRLCNGRIRLLML